MLSFQPPGFRQCFATVPLGRMAYYEPVSPLATWQPDGPTVIFIHGFGGGSSAYEWAQVYGAIAMTHRVIAPDLLGWGDSDGRDRGYSLDEYVESLESFIPQVAGDRPVVLAAASIGGALAVRLANRHPDWIESLFLSCPSGFDDFGEGSGRRLPAELINTPGLDRLIYTVGAANAIAVRSFLERFLFANRDRITPEMVNAYLASALKPNAPAAALRFLRGDLFCDLAPDMAALAVPTAIIWGDRARFTSLAQGRKLADLNRDRVAWFVTLPRCGVVPHLEWAGPTAGLLYAWLAGGDRATPSR
jgi:pimeloyl-ACP methyl ester carboxylesterase